ncbi:MAG: hypothetical protein LBV19_06145 [Streptococcaceae bacterium]|jgi:hypothetical protein|nr:hypothetical protein [Streptococcaceae bacterium]
MNYDEFFKDIISWIYDCNTQAQKLGFFNQEFWDWAVQSLTEICVKYNQDKLAQAQTAMLLDWLEQTRQEAVNK